MTNKMLIEGNRIEANFFDVNEWTEGFSVTGYDCNRDAIIEWGYFETEDEAQDFLNTL